MTNKFVLLYPPSSASMELIGAHLDAHLAHFAAFQAAGEVVGFGPFSERERYGSMALFPSREAVERFVATDPFVVHGVVEAHEIREWQDVTG
ncbi:YciI family protein [Streptomyces sp. NPDC006872]|uniref:YciI family protein n=1 Tax=Streptomyces sp. NPDC006872 TaxID=3155720 RepID=UPI003406DEB3